MKSFGKNTTIALLILDIAKTVAKSKEKRTILYCSSYGDVEISIKEHKPKKKSSVTYSAIMVDEASNLLTKEDFNE